MIAINRKPIVVVIGAAMAMLAVTTTPAFAMGEGFGKHFLNRHLAEYWAKKHPHEEASKQTPDDQFAVSESPIVSDADSSMGRNQSRMVIDSDFLDDPQHYRGR